MKTTKEHIKKWVSMVVVFALITGQVACAPKLQEIRSPIDQVQLPKDYTYTLKLKNQEKIRGLQTVDINLIKDGLKVKTSSETKSLMSKDVEYVYGTSNYNTGNYTLLGIVGGGLGGAAAFILMGSILYPIFSSLNGCEIAGEEPCDSKSYTETVLGPVTWWGMGVGALLGGVTGFMVKKKKQILITPVVTPTTSGVDPGVNVGIKF